MEKGGEVLLRASLMIITCPMFSNWDVCRIGLTSLNPKVCPSNQSKSDPIRSEVKKSIQTDTIRSDPIAFCILVQDLSGVVLYAFHLPETISIVLG